MAQTKDIKQGAKRDYPKDRPHILEQAGDEKPHTTGTAKSDGRSIALARESDREPTEHLLVQIDRTIRVNTLLTLS